MLDTSLLMLAIPKNKSMFEINLLVLSNNKLMNIVLSQHIFRENTHVLNMTQGEHYDDGLCSLYSFDEIHKVRHICAVRITSNKIVVHLSNNAQIEKGTTSLTTYHFNLALERVIVTYLSTQCVCFECYPHVSYLHCPMI